MGYTTITIAYVLNFKSPEREKAWQSYVMGIIIYFMFPALIVYVATRS
jgi:hypothetical protein